MKKCAVLVSFEVKGKIELDSLPCFWEQLTIEDLIEELTHEQLKEFIIENSYGLMLDTYDRLGIIKQVFDELDPMDLFPRDEYGAPLDEYMPEVRAIEENLEEGMTSSELARLIQEVIYFFFDKEMDFEECEYAALKILYYLSLIEEA